MSDGHHSEIISSIVPGASNEHAVELNYISTNSDNHSIDSNTSSSHRKGNFIMSRFQEIVKKVDTLNVEKRGIDRVLPEDRTDSRIINTGMIWVIDLLI
jgi:hypothetical protein